MRKIRKRFIGKQKSMWFTTMVHSYIGDHCYLGNIWVRNKLAARYNHHFDWEANVGHSYGEMIYHKLLEREAK